MLYLSKEMICNLSALANNCEHLNYDKTCSVFSGTPKARANRQLNCKNEQKTVCCYLCVFRSHCPINCKYLGQNNNYTETQQPTPKDASPASVSSVVDKTLNDESLPPESIPVAFCFSCNIEMAWTKTHFSIDFWRGNKHSLLDNNENVLPATILLCPKCGKIEFKANLTKKEEAMHNGSS